MENHKLTIIACIINKNKYNTSITKLSYLKHFPGRTLPALPARCLADALDIGVTTKLSMSEI